MPADYRSGDVLIVRDERWTLVQASSYPDACVIDVRGAGRSNGGVRTRFLLPAEPVQRVIVSTEPRRVRPTEWRRLAAAALSDAQPSCVSLRTPTSATFDLLPFQLEPALAVVRGLAARVLIADEVGLGKTIQAGLVVAEVLGRTPDAHVLVVCPAGLREQWCGELLRRFSLAATVIDSASLARASSIVLDGANPWSATSVVVTSIDYVKRPEVIRSLESVVWDVLVFDEAHSLAGPSDRSAAAHALADRARVVLLLTATPHSGDHAAFERLTQVGDINGAFPLAVFRRTRANAGLQSSRRTMWLRVRPSAAETAMHKAVLAYAQAVWREQPHNPDAPVAPARLVMAVLMRRACSSAASLARSVERRLALLSSTTPAEAPQLALPFADGDDDEEWAATLGVPGLADRRREVRVLGQLLQLARAAASRESKLAALQRLLRRSRQPALVFTAYRDTLATLAAALASFRPLQLHGGLTRSERRDVLDAFNDGPDTVLLATDAASEGLNLHQRCRLVINLELPWTPLRLEQRIGRVDRIGQAHRVHAINLVAGGTAEELTVSTLLRRAAMAASALGAMRPPELSEEQVAGQVINGDAPQPADGGGGTARFAVVDLRAAAYDEAQRLGTWRALAAQARGAVTHGRAFMTRASSRRRDDCFVFRAAYVNRSNRIVWEQLLGIASRSRMRTTSDLLAVARGHQTAQLMTLQQALAAPLELALRREQAILELLQSRGCRLAAALLQAGLFDRRAERLTDAQASVIQNAIDRSSARQAELSAGLHLNIDRVELAFGLLAR